MPQAVLSSAPLSVNVVRSAPGERETRPWGNWEVVAVGPNSTSKRIEIHAGQRLSLQYSEFSSERWTILAGRAEVEIDGRTRLAKAGDHVFIPRRAPHRIKNIGAETLTFVEVQTG